MSTYQRPTLRPPKVEESTPILVTMLGGLLSIIVTGATVALFLWIALSIAGVSVFSVRELYAIGIGYVTIRAVDLLMVKASKSE
jgi:hypothetical protein